MNGPTPWQIAASTEANQSPETKKFTTEPAEETEETEETEY
jgi:hypothetical protein